MVDGAVLISVLIGLVAAPRSTRRTGEPRARRRGRRRARPEAFLALVVGLVYVNQVLFTVYMLRVHGGDASFIAKYLPEGYFALADGPAMRGLAEHFPKPELLAPSLLRVQAFFELPFALLALTSVVVGLRWALLLFFVPALAVRYGVNFGTPLIAVAAGLAVCLAAAIHALRETLPGTGTARIAAWAAQTAVALLAGAAAGYAALQMVTDTYYEAGLLRAAGAAFAAAFAACAVTDRWLARRRARAPV